jgi:DNA-3-methyladenine glycosylase
MGEGQPLDREFFDRSVHDVAVDLLGCHLLVDGVGGTIVETESYAPGDPACHSYRGQTKRNAPMFGPAAHAYVYLSYGIHTMLNIVCEGPGSAAAVLVRAIEPTDGVELMRERRGRRDARDLCSGPGKLAQALGIGLELSGASMFDPPFQLIAREGPLPVVVRGPRIGITKGTELPWRYSVESNRFVSRPWPSAQVTGLAA